ncbi:HEAT repeat domain-containing protein [Myxococcus dinghuensis]|uniref:HEAT repeat domain-containing protein n=1 Tax=Myxococcus dinghuensis TaxID=2906761 RepID=UPI00389945E0
MVSILLDRKEDPKVRGQASEALGYGFANLKTTSEKFLQGVSALLEALGEPSPEVRYCAAFALGCTGHPPLLPVLEKMRADQTPVPGGFLPFL